MTDKTPDMAEMEERRLREQAIAENPIEFGAWFAILRKPLWKIALLSLAVGIVTLVVMFRMPDIYQATAVITPASDDNKPSPALGALASFGIAVGGPTKVEDLENLFKSSDLTVRVFRRHELWASIYPDHFDRATGKIRPTWRERLPGKTGEPKPPGEWDAIRVAKESLRVSVNKKLGTIVLTFESVSPEVSAAIVGHYLEEARSRLQEEAFERAARNKKFIEEQIGRTVDALTRDRLYSLYGQEVEREMLARNREQFGFRIIDAPRVPDRKSRPARAKGAVAATLLTFFGLCAFLLFRGSRRRES